MLRDMHQPAAKKIKDKKGDYNCGYNIGVKPIHHAKPVVQTPVAKFNKDDGQKSMDYQVQDRKTNVYRRMPQLCLFIM